MRGEEEGGGGGREEGQGVAMVQCRGRAVTEVSRRYSFSSACEVPVMA